MPRLNVARFGPRFWLTLPFRLPFLVAESVASGLKLSRLTHDFADRFRREVLPAFAAEAAKGEAEDLAALDPPALLERLEHWMRRTLVDFARDSLKPTALAAIAMRAVEDKLRPRLGPGRVPAAVGALTTGVRPDPEADLPGAMNELAAGRLDRAVFLQHFGWRGSQEMELAEPRWSEDAGRAGSDGRAAGWPARPGGDRPGGRGRVAGDHRGRQVRAGRPPGAPAGRGRAANLRRPARDGQALPDARLRPHPPHSPRNRSPLSLAGRHLLPDAGGTAAADRGGGPDGA